MFLIQSVSIYHFRLIVSFMIWNKMKHLVLSLTLSLTLTGTIAIAQELFRSQVNIWLTISVVLCILGLSILEFWLLTLCSCCLFTPFDSRCKIVGCFLFQMEHVNLFLHLLVMFTFFRQPKNKVIELFVMLLLWKSTTIFKFVWILAIWACYWCIRNSKIPKGQIVGWFFRSVSHARLII